MHWDIWLTRNTYTIEPDLAADGDDGKDEIKKVATLLTRDKRKPTDEDLLEQMAG